MKENPTSPTFIIIDDDSTNNFICSRFIKRMIPGVEVKTFTNPEEGLAHIMAEYVDGNTKPGVLFLDVNMPGLSGWDVLDKLKAGPQPLKTRLNVYMLSSSINQEDKSRALRHQLVLGYMEKPLVRQHLQQVMAGFDIN